MNGQDPTEQSGEIGYSPTCTDVPAAADADEDGAMRIAGRMNKLRNGPRV